MKPIHFFWLLLVSSTLQGQTTSPSVTTTVVLPARTPYAVVSRDDNSAVWQRQTYEAGSNGTIITNVHLYVELATGLNYKDAATGSWLPSREEIDAYPGGAIARYGQHKIIFANNLNTQGAIDLQTPDGKELRSDILGLSYYDSASSKSVLIAQVQDSQGQIVSSNQVVYPNAFQGLSANVRYCYTRAGLEQDVILLTQLPRPESFGLSATSCVLQVLTEFTAAPAPVIQASPSVTNDALADEMLDFGAMKMVRGRAFLLGTNSPAVLISKQWLNVGGRTVLVESMPLASITKSLSELPAISATSLNRHPGSVQYLVSNQRLLPSPRTAATIKTEMKVALSGAAARGFDLDLIFVNSSSNPYTFAGDNTYWVTGPVNFSSDVTFEGGSVIKYSENAYLNINDPGQIICEGAAYRPTVFTSKDDNSVGTAIGTGFPSSFNANPAIGFIGSNHGASSMTLHHFRIAYAMQAIYASGLSVNAVVEDGQIVECSTGFSSPGQTGASFGNVLFANVLNPFQLGIASVQVYNSTFSHLSTDLSPLAIGEAGLEGSASLMLENCILANIYTYSTNMPNLVTGDHNGFYNSGAGSQSQYGRTTFGTSPIPATGPPFQSAGSGSYYLASGCGFFNEGTANIDPVLLADLKSRTTYPPQLLTSDFTGNTTLAPNPNVVRDNSSSPDLGYHYAPLDYCLSGLSAGTTLTLTNGVAIGIYGSSGLSVGGQLISQGTPTNHNQLVYYSLVQEQPSFWGAHPFNNLFSSLNQARLRFTDVCMAAGQTWNFSPNVDGGGISLVDCQLQTAFFNMVGMNWGGMAFTNNIFARCNLVFNDVAGGYSLNFYNNLFLGGTLSLNLYNLNWNVYDNLFNSANFHIWNYAPNHGYNAYYNAAIPYDPHTGYTTPGNQALTTLDFQAGALGSYYYPKTGSGLNLLRNAGSTTADKRGLYHYSVTTDGAIEGNNTVSIGYHYVATDDVGNPMDTDGDGLPDYIEDGNGNGVYDPGTDLSDWQNPFTDGSGMDDGWEVKYFGHINIDPYADPDGDGYVNLEEYQNGTDPTVFNSPPKSVSTVQVLHDSVNPSNIDVTWNSVPSATGYTIARTINGTTTYFTITGGGTTSWTDTSVPPGSSPTYTVTANFSNGGNPTQSPPSPGGNGDTNPLLAITATVVRGQTSDSSHTPLQIVLGEPVPANVQKIRVHKQIVPTQFRTFEGQDQNGINHWGWVFNILSGSPVINWPGLIDAGSFDVPIGSFSGGVYLIPTSQAQESVGYQFQLQPVGTDGRVGVENGPIFVRNIPFVDGSVVVKRNLNFILRAARGGDPNGYGALRFNATADYAAASPYVMEQSLSAPATDELAAFYENWFMRNWLYNSGAFLWGTDGQYYYAEFFAGNNIGSDGVGYNPEQVYYNFDGYSYVSGANSPFKATSSQINDADYVYLQAASLYLGQNLSGAGISWDGTSESLAMNFVNLFGLTYQNVRATEIRYPYGDTTLNVRTIAAGGTSANPDPTYFSEYFQQTAVPSLQTVDYYFVPDTGSSAPQLSYYPIPGDPNPNEPVFSVNDTSPVIIASVGQERGIYGWAKQSVGTSGKHAYLGQYFDPTSVPTGEGILSEYGEFTPLHPGQFTLKTKADPDQGGMQGSCTVYAISLNVDANHDGNMDLTYGGPDTTSANQPMEFWVNSGDYGTGPGQLVDAKTVVPDYSYEYIRSQFGLENFARLRICDVPTLPAGYTATLSLSGSLAINLYSVADGSTGYLNNSSTASGLVNEPSLNGQTPISAGHPYTFSPTFFNGSDKYFLFEGAGIGEGQLTLTIYQNGNIVAQSSVWLNLQDIKAMYQRAAGTPDDVSFPPPYNQDGSSDYINYNFNENVLGIQLDNRIPFQQPPNESPQCVVFVHGWNMDYNEYIGFSEEMFKRLYWQGYQGRFCAFRWATLTSPFSYNTSEFRAWKYGLPLKGYVEYLKASLPGYSMNIVAHSMGNIVAGSALYRGLTVDNYALLQAAVPAGCYDTSANINSYSPFTSLEANNPTADYANPDLGYRGYLANVSGNLVNFYNPDDFALATGNLGGLTHVPFLWWLGPAVNWEANEESYKPDSLTVVLLNKNYKYNPNATPSSQRGWLTLGTFGIDHYVTDPQEMMSFIARPRSKAVGALEGVGGTVKNEINLGAGSTENFGRERSDHSGEFNRPIQQLTSFYQSLLDTLVPLQ